MQGEEVEAIDRESAGRGSDDAADSGRNDGTMATATCVVLELIGCNDEAPPANPFDQFDECLQDKQQEAENRLHLHLPEAEAGAGAPLTPNCSANLMIRFKKKMLMEQANAQMNEGSTEQHHTPGTILTDHQMLNTR